MLIAIDHGNKQVKSVHCPPFVSGLQQSSTRPFGRDVLEYQDYYYTLSARRIPYQKDKTADERYFILTLFAIANEIEQAGVYCTPGSGHCCGCNRGGMEYTSACITQ